MLSALPDRLRGWLPDNPDESLLRWIFRAVLAATISVLATDLVQLNGWIGERPPANDLVSEPSWPGALPSV
jgi:hypothetical protein